MLLGEDDPEAIFPMEYVLSASVACLNDADRYSCDQHGMTCSVPVSCS